NWMPPEFALVTGASGTVAGTGGNPDFGHAASSDQGALTGETGTFALADGGTELAAGYRVGGGDTPHETHTHVFSADVGSVQLRLTGLNTAETLVIWVDGQPLDLNQAMALGLVEFAS